jgi:hypothetical protein
VAVTSIGGRGECCNNGALEPTADLKSLYDFCGQRKVMVSFTQVWQVYEGTQKVRHTQE